MKLYSVSQLVKRVVISCAAVAVITAVVCVFLMKKNGAEAGETTQVFEIVEEKSASEDELQLQQNSQVLFQLALIQLHIHKMKFKISAFTKHVTRLL